MNWKYDRVVCINLERRPDNWEQFKAGIPSGFPFGTVERFAALDGRKVPRPDWWRGGGGAWGCYCSHRRIIEECLNNDVKSVLIFEDDAQFCDGFAQKVAAFHNHLPNDAQWIYYGGQHLRQAVQTPQRVNDFVYTPFNVNRTHAYGIVGTEAMRTMYKHLCRKDWTTAHHIDHHYGRLCQKQTLKTYCPAQWLVDQRGGRSDVAGREKDAVHWMDAVSIADGRQEPFYAVLGCHSSGSSALAGVLYHLGVHLGNSLTGMYGKPPIRGGEAVDLRNLFEQSAPVPLTGFTMPKELIKYRLQRFVDCRRSEAKGKHTVAAGKYPQMAAAGDILYEILGEKLRLIICQRPIEKSIASLYKRFPRMMREQIEAHQRWIADGINQVRSLVDEDSQLVVQYDDLLNSPEQVVQELTDFMGLTPTVEQISAAVNYVRPELKHF